MLSRFWYCLLPLALCSSAEPPSSSLFDYPVGQYPALDTTPGISDTVVLTERMPYFFSEECPAFIEGISSSTLQELKNCAETAMLTYIYSHLKVDATTLPKQKRRPVRYTTRVGFVIETDGSITGVETITKSIPPFDLAARSVVSGMPAWRSGIQRGKPVRVSFVLPIHMTW